MEAILYPLSVWLDNRGRPAEIIRDHSDQAWAKLIRQLRYTCNDFDDMYGVKIDDIQRWNDDLIMLSYEIVDENKWQNQYQNSVVDTLAALLNHNLQAGGYPSFYNDNLEDGEMIFSYLGLSNE